MSVERVFHCDGPDCQTHQRVIMLFPPPAWVVVRWENKDHFFCTWDCVLRYGAKFEPVERIEA